MFLLYVRYFLIVDPLCAEPPYVLKKFCNTPGIYYEEIPNEAGRIGMETSDKIRRKGIRDHQQLQDYIEETERECGKIIGNAQLTCRNVMRIIEKDNMKLITLLETLYKTTYRR
ncbi:hypothetical protein P5V15_015605 [Pogonomyrmex californicus]